MITLGEDRTDEIRARRALPVQRHPVLRAKALRFWIRDGAGGADLQRTQDTARRSLRVGEAGGEGSRSEDAYLRRQSPSLRQALRFARLDGGHAALFLPRRSSDTLVDVAHPALEFA